MRRASHVQRPNYEDIIKTILNRKPDLKMRAGISKLRWMDGVAEDAENIRSKEM